MRDAVVAVLLVAAVAAVWLSALGMLVVRDPYDRLHFTTPPAFAGVLIAAAVAVRLGPAIATEQAIVLAVLLVVSSPVSVQVLARATYARLGRPTQRTDEHAREEAR